MGNRPRALENLGLSLFATTFGGRRVLVTGHTGFKGSWLALWLRELGAQVSGISLDPETSPNHWDLLGLEINDHRHDIRDADGLQRLVAAARPDIVFHLAAQPLVRRSYGDPLATWSTNVVGTANLLEACRSAPSVSAIVVVTTDKCYENRDWEWGYRENDRLGGHDPYSASKAATELVVASYRQSFFHEPGSPLLASARAGNVIGGGDWSEDRLIPDLVRARAAGAPLEIRSPQATRPWQHVLEALSGYLLLGQGLLQGRRDFARAWNFGPDGDSNCSVEQLLTAIKREWPAIEWRQTGKPMLHEANLLQLDATLARQKLGWRPIWSLNQALAVTAAWYRRYLEQGEVNSLQQLRDYIAAGDGAAA